MKNAVRLIPNSITLTRIVMTGILSYFLIQQFAYNQGKFINLIFMFLYICVSDLVDGRIARKMGWTSTLGAKLDVSADLLYIITSYLVLIYLKVLPLWFLIFVCLKFGEFVATSKFIRNYSKESNHPFVFDRVGRIVSATFFIIPGIACIFKCLMIYNGIYLLNCFLGVITVAGIYSSYQRIRSCVELVTFSRVQS